MMKLSEAIRLGAADAMKRLLLILAIALDLGAQTKAPDLNGVWILGSPYNGVLYIQKRTERDFFGRVERAGQAPRPITGIITPGTPNPAVLGIRIEEHAPASEGTQTAIFIWEAYTTGPDTLVGVTPDQRTLPSGFIAIPGGWPAARFNPEPTPAPVATPSVESVKLDQLAVAIARLEALVLTLVNVNIR